jgi:hypothetical protein
VILLYNAVPTAVDKRGREIEMERKANSVWSSWKHVLAPEVTCTHMYVCMYVKQASHIKKKGGARGENSEDKRQEKGKERGE